MSVKITTEQVSLLSPNPICPYSSIFFKHLCPNEAAFVFQKHLITRPASSQISAALRHHFRYLYDAGTIFQDNAGRVTMLCSILAHVHYYIILRSPS